MSKLISTIQNYPLSEGSVPYSNSVLLRDSLTVRQKPLKDYLKVLLEISKDIYFFNDLGTNSNTWNDLLKKESIFQFSRFLTIAHEELHQFFTDLPQRNNFNSDIEITEDEYETLAYQRLQIIQYLFWFYKIVGETITDENQPQVLSILKYGAIGKLYVQYKTLADECLDESSLLIEPVNQNPVADFNDISFPKIEKDLADSLKKYYSMGAPNGNPLLIIYPTAFDKIKAANEYAYTIFRSLLKIHQTFTAWATNRLTELTGQTNTHQPHIALLIAFCKLKMLYDLRYDQLIHSNTHFTFSDILQVKKQSVLPDTAFVNIELAKNVNQYLVEKGTLFKAGKNADNKTVYYESTQNIVLNSAKITYLKSSVRISRQNTLTTITATDDAANSEWQVNDAWLPFNDLSESHTGIAIESKLLASVQKKNTLVDFLFNFENSLPQTSNLQDKFKATLVLNDGSEAVLKVYAVSTEGSILKISARIENDLKVAVQVGINARLKLISPGKNEQDGGNVILYKFLLRETIGKVTVKVNQQSFVPSNVETASGFIDGSTGFIAFGSQSLAGSSFRIVHPFLKFARAVDITVQWAEALQQNVSVTINNQSKTINSGSETTLFKDFNTANSSSLLVRLTEHATHEVESTITRNQSTYTVKSTLPSVLQVKSVELTAELEEIVYEKENNRPVLFVEEIFDNRFFVKSLRIPYTSKIKQNQVLYNRYLSLKSRVYRPHHNNLTAHLYPLGELNVYKTSGLTFLPDYSILGFNDFEADLYIGITDISPGQSISLLFEIADETAGQSQLEAKISWYFISNNSFEAIDPSKIIDSTNNFLQTGIVQLSLPENATDTNTILYGNDTYWLVARCDKNHEVVANIKNIKTNGFETLRVLNEDNTEAKKTVAAGTIENIFPKTANIKSVSQNTPSQNGRETETDLHYFWRSSQRLRHKQRAINQWDFEQLVLENFSNIYKVKCLNHAYYDDKEARIMAKAAHVIISLAPYYLVNATNVNFQPAIPMSRLLAIKEYLLGKTSSFLQVQVMNPQWDEVSIILEVVLNKNVLDLLFYRIKLDEDVKHFLAPWAFQTFETPILAQKIYSSTLVDFIDELPYVHHITSLRMFKNSIEVFDEIKASSEIHFLTSALEHSITVSGFES